MTMAEGMMFIPSRTGKDPDGALPETRPGGCLNMPVTSPIEMQLHAIFMVDNPDPLFYSSQTFSRGFSMTMAFGLDKARGLMRGLLLLLCLPLLLLGSLPTPIVFRKC
jgi:hypothetical protein